MDELLYFHWHDDLLLVLIATGSLAPEAEFEPTFFLDRIHGVGELESALDTTVLEGWGLFRPIGLQIVVVSRPCIN
jgi:hypothetical protein